MNKKCIITGAGFVGATFYQALCKTPGWDFYAYDINPQNSKLQKDYNKEIDKCVKYEDENPDYCAYPPFEIHWIQSLEEQKDAQLFIVALPTPMSLETGECHTGIVEGAIQAVRTINQDSWIVIKSTVPPGTTQKWNQQYGKVCFSPEFLTEANPFNDFVHLPYQMVGFPEFMPGLIDSLDCPLEELFRAANEANLIDATSTLITDCTTAECVKYMRNTYLALRLSFFNEWFDICRSLDVDYGKVKIFAGLDERVGQHYNNVTPERGWGLSCFPKDLNAMIKVQKDLGLEPTMMKATWEKNLEVRKPEFRDWEKMEKAVIKK